MWPYYPDLLATPVPRYTSYPTAVEFGPTVGPSDLAEAIRSARGDVSLYLHIPFCQEICWYCGCNTGRANRKDRVSAYLDALHAEVALVGSLLAPGTRVRRIAFGGGSPNAVAPVDFVRLMTTLTQLLPLADPEISIEIDPRTLDPRWRSVLAGVRATRASLGVQTFEPHLQAAIGRIQPLATIMAATDLLREAGVTSLNYDLMYGLPGQTLGDLRATLERAASLGADRIALFGYAHVPQVVPRQRRIDATALPDQQARFEMAAMGYRWLSDAGYVPVGFDHFALPGDPMAQAMLSGRLRRNFQGFTDDGAQTLIGLGASAISSFPGLLAQNEKNAGRYGMMLSQHRLTAVLGCHRSADDRARAEIIENLLCSGRAAIPLAMLAGAANRLGAFIARGLVRVDGDVLTIEPGGLPYARTVAAMFDSYRNLSDRKFSSAV